MKIDVGNSPSSGLAPFASSFVVISGDLITTNLSIIYDTRRVKIDSMKVMMVDFNLGNFKALPYDKSGQKWALFGTSGVATDPSATSSYLSTYQHNYFFGLTTLYDADFSLGTLSFDAATANAISGFYFTSEILIVSYYCPSSFPITDNKR